MAKNKQAKTSGSSKAASGAAAKSSAKRAGTARTVAKQAKTSSESLGKRPPGSDAPAFGAPDSGCRIRLKVSYYIADPARWWAAFHADLSKQHQAGIYVHDLHCRYKPQRHQGHPYKIVLRAKVRERAAAETFMRTRTIHSAGKRTGILMDTITNRWRG